MEHENLPVAEQLKALHKIENIKQRIASLEDLLQSWMGCYLDLLIRPIRDEQITAKFILHLTRFLHFFGVALRKLSPGAE